jgi:hypothetical protein
VTFEGAAANYVPQGGERRTMLSTRITEGLTLVHILL